MRTKTTRRRAAAWVALLALLLAGLLPVAASADDVSSMVSEGTCDGLGYTKPSEMDGINGGIGSFEVKDGDTLVATIAWDGDTVTVEVEPGFELDLCIKSGSERPIFERSGLTSEDSPFVDTGPQEVSHIGYLWRRLPEPEPVDLELLKVWEDVDGTPMAPVTGVPWSAQVRYGNGDATGIEIGGSTVSDTGPFEVGRTRYQVVERAGDGVTEVDCSQATMARVNSAYRAGRDVLFDGTGLFRAPETDTLHVVCNTPDADLPELELLKVWQGEDSLPISPLTGIDWSAFVLYGNGDPTDIEIGGTTVSDTGVFAAGRTRYQVVEPEDDAFNEVLCSEATMARVEAAYANGREVFYAGTGVFAAPTEDTLHVICNTPSFFIDVDKVVTGDTAPTDGEFEICVETFPYVPPATEGPITDIANGELVDPVFRDCRMFGHGDEFRFDDLWPDEFRVWERDANPDPSSIGYTGDGAPAPELLDGVIVDLTWVSPTASVTVTNRYPDITIQTRNYYLDFEKTWTLDSVSGRLSDLTIDGYDAAFEVLGVDDVAVPVTIDDVTLSAGGQSVADGARRTVSLNNDYLLEESVPALADDLLCTIETTFSYDGEALVPNAAGDVVFTTPTFAANGTTFTIDVENEVVCDAVLGEVVVPVDIEAAKSWYQTSDDGLVALDEAPDGAAPSYEVVVKGPDAEIVLVDELDAGATLTVPELEDGATYLVTWEEIEPLAEFELDGATCTWNKEESDFVGTATFVAGEVDTVGFTGVNVYDCLEVLDTVVTPTPAALPQTGAPAMWLTLIGLLGVGLGAGILSRRHVPR